MRINLLRVSLSLIVLFFFYSEQEDLDEEVFYSFILVVLYLQNTLIYEKNIFRLTKY